MNDKNKDKIILTTIWVVTLIVFLMGASFAYFTSVGKSSPQVIVTKSLNVSVVLKGASNVDQIVPTTWSDDMDKNNTNKNITKIPFKISSSSRVNGVYSIKMLSNIKENESFKGGSAEDIKYRLYKDNKEISNGNFNIGDVNIEIADGKITENKDLNDDFMLYVYIDNKNESQNKLQDINFNITLQGEVSVVE